jgi:hypothetical protein
MRIGYSLLYSLPAYRFGVTAEKLNYMELLVDGWNDDENYANDVETIATVRGWYLNDCDFFVSVQYKYQDSTENKVLRYVALEEMKEIVKIKEKIRL